MTKLRLYIPVKPYGLNQGFGGNYDSYKQFGIKGHNGLDLRASHGQPVYAAHDGICYPEIDSSGGNGVVIRTNDHFDYEDKQAYFRTIYWHLIQDDAIVKTGQQVKAGDLIGYADSTGYSSGDHLHFGLKPEDWDPKDWQFFNLEYDNGYKGAIDPTPYMCDIFAEDVNKMLLLLLSLKDALVKLLALKRS